MEASDAAQRRRRTIGANIRLARQLASGMTQEYLGDQVGVARTRVIAWEKGRIEPSPAKIEKLAEVLEQPEWWFYVEHADDEVAA